MPRIPSWPLIVLAALGSHAAAASPPPARNVTVLAHWNEYPVPPPGQPYAYSACWSYVHDDGREYALLGVASGTAIYDITDPADSRRVAFIPGPPSIWREMKSYRRWVYIVTEGTGAGQGLQIVRMTDPEHPVLAATYTTGFVRSHTVQVDSARALLLCNGTRDSLGAPAGMHILSIADPEAPVEIARWPSPGALADPATYVHDDVVSGTTLYASSVYAGVERVFDLADPAAPADVRDFTYPGSYYTHSAWPDSTGQWLYVTDERSGQPLRVFPTGASGLAQPANQLTSNPAAIVHNPRVKGHELYLANYTEGVRVLDITDPVRPAEFAWLDTYPGVSGGYGGVWEVCPYFPSGTVIASDMQSGLWVFRPERDYARLQVDVVSPDGAGADTALAGATIEIAGEGDSLSTGRLGSQAFGPGPGSWTVRGRAYGFHPDSALVTLASGEARSVRLRLLPRERAALSGAVRDLTGNAPLAGAEISLGVAPLATRTDAAGDYALEGVPADRYRIEVRRAGYVPDLELRDIGPGGTQVDFGLRPAKSWDALETAAGWSVSNSPGVANGWNLSTPVASSGAAPPAAAGASARPSGEGPSWILHEEPPPLAPGGSTPLEDHSPDPDSLCFITGQAPDTAALSANPLAGGISVLTSPDYSLAGLRDPVIGFWSWFFSWNPGTAQPDPDDWLAVLISHNGGSTWAVVDTLRGLRPGWQEVAIRVADHVPSSGHARLRFVAAEQGAASLARMAVDDVVTYEATAPAAVGPGSRAVLGIGPPWPNPASGRVRFTVRAPRPGNLEVRITDVAGRRVRLLHAGPAAAGALPFEWDGRDGRGHDARAGLYFVRANLDGAEVSARIVRVK